MIASKMKAIAMILMLLVSMPLLADVSRPDAVALVQRYQDALRTNQHAQLREMLDQQARVRIDLVQGESIQRFTLTPARFLQQFEALARFARERRLDFSSPRYHIQPQGDMKVVFRQTERRVLFGENTHQQDEVELLLARRDGEIRIVDVHSQSRLW